MEMQSPLKKQENSLPETQHKLLELTPKARKVTQSPTEFHLLENSPTVADVISIPSCSRWFSWDKVHESERRSLPEFFDDKSPSKNIEVYMYYRNLMIKMFRESPSRKITYTQVRKVLVGDVGSIRRVFDFLENWGLINYTGPTTKQQSKLDDKENKSTGDIKGNLYDTLTSTRFCSECKTLCTIACFICDKSDLTLCARCYVRGDYRVRFPDAAPRRVAISEETKTEWTDKETLQLLEAIMHYGDDWKKVAEHVGGRSKEECVARFIKLPFKEQFISSPDCEEVDSLCSTSPPRDDLAGEDNSVPSSPAKRRRLTPFADTSNPIMAQVAFLSAMVGSAVAEASACAAVEALSGSNLNTDRRHMERNYTSLPDHNGQNGTDDRSESNTETLVESVADIHQEEEDLEKAITTIVDLEMKELKDKIVDFEQVEMQMEKEWKQVEYMKKLLFTDQLTLLFQTNVGDRAASSEFVKRIT